MFRFVKNRHPCGAAELAPTPEADPKLPYSFDDGPEIVQSHHYANSFAPRKSGILN
jgi:hypothetical protein